MNDKAHIRLVNAHAKGDRCHHYLYVILNEAGLIRPFFVT